MTSFASRRTCRSFWSPSLRYKIVIFGSLPFMGKKCLTRLLQITSLTFYTPHHQLYEIRSLLDSSKSSCLEPANRVCGYAHLGRGGYGIRRSEAIQSLAIGE